MTAMGQPPLSPSTRLIMLASLSLSSKERETMLAAFGHLSQAVESLEGFVSPEATPATTFSPQKSRQEDP